MSYAIGDVVVLSDGFHPRPYVVLDVSSENVVIIGLTTKRGTHQDQVLGQLHGDNVWGVPQLLRVVKVLDMPPKIGICDNVNQEELQRLLAIT